MLKQGSDCETAASGTPSLKSIVESKEGHTGNDDTGTDDDLQMMFPH